MTFLLLLFGASPAKSEALPPIAVAKVLCGDKLARLDGRLDLLFRYGHRPLGWEGLRDPDVRSLLSGGPVDFAAFEEPQQWMQLLRVVSAAGLEREGDDFVSRTAAAKAYAARALAVRLGLREPTGSR